MEILRHRLGTLDVTAPVLMGVVNVTPDSFSDGGLAWEEEAAIARGLELVSAGAAIVDVGGESTRPGAKEVEVGEELRRVLGVIEGLAEQGVLVSTDTRKAAVAREALLAGAAIVNDVSGLRDPAMRAVVAETGAGVIVMHMQGEPSTMQLAPSYEDVTSEVLSYLRGQLRLACDAGIEESRIAVDPGIGFGKTLAHNLELLRGLRAFSALSRPLVIGTSRKSFLGALLGGRPPGERVAAGLCATLYAVDRGARIVRTHDVRETAEVLRVRAALVDTTSGLR